MSPPPERLEAKTMRLGGRAGGVTSVTSARSGRWSDAVVLTTCVAPPATAPPRKTKSIFFDGLLAGCVGVLDDQSASVNDRAHMPFSAASSCSTLQSQVRI